MRRHDDAEIDPARANAPCEHDEEAAHGDDEIRSVHDRGAALDLDELGADLVVGRIDGGIDVVADLERGILAEAFEVTAEGFT